MVRAKVRKHLYWHTSAKLLLEHGVTPTNVAKALKLVFPHTEVTGRHIGAYKRRLVLDSMIEKDLPKTLDLQEAYGMVEGIVSDEDRYVYQCVVGSAKSTLKCFEYKLTIEAEEPQEGIETWLLNMAHITQT